MTEDVQENGNLAGLDPVAAPESEPAKPQIKRSRRSSGSDRREFPRNTIEDSLQVANAIKDKNGGNPWVPDQIATALGMGKGNKFYYVTASSRDYGLTEGTRDAAEIRVTELGRRAVYPKSPDEKTEALREAFFPIEVFKSVVEHYGGSKLPEEPFLSNTLDSQFGLKREQVNEFVDVFEANCRFLGIGNTYPSDESSRPVIANGAATIVVSSPDSKTKTGLVCFVAMPFTERDDDRPIGFFEEVMQSLFTPAITAAGFEARTAKRQGSDVIQATIVSELLNADLVLVDLTEHNPNVLFELGMRMHADKPIALVRAKGTGAIFDVDNLLRVEEYNPNLWPSTVGHDVDRLTAHIKASWDSRDASQTYMQILKSRTS